MVKGIFPGTVFGIHLFYTIKTKESRFLSGMNPVQTKNGFFSPERRAMSLISVHSLYPFFRFKK